MVDAIKEGVVVTMAYRMVVDGEEVESSPANDPLYYLHGSDNIVPGLEAALEGKGVGTKLTVELAPADAYGEYDPEALLTDPLSEFDLPDSIKEGDEVEIEDADGDLFIATVKSITDDELTLDMNHAFAGKTVTFEVEVLGLRDASKEELEWGEPEELIGSDHDHDH
jgi:FKBP-type peptidyl-prolyl cis-trans isomerase SlyD